MQYKLYPDVIFLINFVTDYCVIIIWAKLRKHTTTYIKKVLCSMLGAIYSVVFTIYDDMPELLMLFFTYILFPTVILRILGCRFDREGLYSFLLYYMVNIFLGGLLGIFASKGVDVVKLLCVFVLSVQVMTPLLRLLTGYVIKKHEIYRTVLMNGEGSVELSGLYDTGNRLVDPYNGKIVHVVEKEKVEEIVDLDSMSKVRYIPFKSVGNEDGLMRLVTISKMIVDTGERKYELHGAELAVYEGRLAADGSYNIILSSDVFL